MNAVTKVFIVLLVVCSLLLVAASVVFVHRMEDYRLQAKLAQDNEKVARQAEATALANSRASESVLQAQAVAGKSVIKNLEDRIQTARKDAVDALARVAELKQGEAAKDVEIAKQRGLAEQAVASAAALQTMTADLREKYIAATEQKNNVEATNAALVTKIAQLDQQVKMLVEQVAMLRDQNRRLQSAAADGNGDKSNPALVGVVNDVHLIQDMYWATISLGSADHVERGMKFIGELIIDDVKPSESFGRLVGRKVNEVKKGMQVKTGNAG